MNNTTEQKTVKKTEIELFIINKVRELRERENIGQKKLSMELKLSSSYVGNAENPYNKAKYNLNHLNELAKIFNVPFSYFFPENYLEKDCVEEYLDIHPRVRANYEKMMKKYEEKALKEQEKRENKKKKGK